jgi:hypothetical protein
MPSTLWFGIPLAMVVEFFVFVVFGDVGLHHFSGAEHPLVFLGSGILDAAAIRSALGALLFTEAGSKWLERYGL